MGKKKCPEFENHERWLVSYADMLTLLFAVFVVLFALKEGGEPQVQKAAGAMQESFNTPLEDIPPDRRAGDQESGFGIFDHFRGQSVRQPVILKFPAPEPRPKVADQEMNRALVELEERLYGPEKFRDPKKAGFERVISVERTTKGFKFKLSGRHFYEKGQTKIRRSALKELDAVIAIVKELGRDVRVEGHTDSVPPKGKYSNWDLSALRATQVVRYMIRKHRFPQSRLSAVGYADLQPIAHNGSKSGRDLNRRIEFHVEYSQDG